MLLCLRLDGERTADGDDPAGRELLRWTAPGRAPPWAVVVRDAVRLRALIVGPKPAPG